SRQFGTNLRAFAGLVTFDRRILRAGRGARGRGRRGGANRRRSICVVVDPRIDTDGGGRILDNLGDAQRNLLVEKAYFRDLLGVAKKPVWKFTQVMNDPAAHRKRA